MMRSLKLTLGVFALALPSFAAFSSNSQIQWDLRTTGSNGNGGGFVAGASGTDRSQADAAFCTATDLVLASSTTATSATCPFSAASVGNLVNVTAGTGFTVQRCVVTSVATVTATLTCQGANAGTGGSTGGSFALGGALQTWATAIAPTVSTFYNTIWVKAGTYTLTTGLAFGNDVVGLEIEGYSSTHGDLGAKPLLTTATNSTTLVTLGPSNDSPSVTFRNISLSNTAGTRAPLFFVDTTRSVNKLTLDRCLLDGGTYGVDSNTNSTGTAFSNLFILKTELKNSTVGGIRIWSGTYIYGSNFHDNAGIGIFQGAGAVTLLKSVIATSGSIGVQLFSSNGGGNNAGGLVAGNAFYSNAADGLQNAGATHLVAIDNIFESNGQSSGTGYGYAFENGNISATTYGFNNAYYNNKSGAMHCTSQLTCEVGAITLTGSPFTNAAGGNFALNSTSGSGASVKAAGYLGTIPNGGAGFEDVGALQSQAGTSGGNYAFAQ